MKNTLTFNKLNIVDCVDSLNDGSNELWLHFQRMTSVVVTGHGIIIADPDIKINSSWYLTSDLILNIDGRIITIKHPTTTTGQMMVRRVSDNIYQLSFGGESGIVDITPVLTEGVEIAQYTIDGETGSIYAPEGVSKEYVDNADLEIKKEAAEASNDKYDESAIPSQLTNKLYVFGNPQGMYPASEIGGDVPAITEGRVDYSIDYWDSDVYPNREDYKIYNSIYNRLFCIKSANDSVSNYYSMFCTDGSEEITAIGSDIRQSVRDSLAGHLNTYVQRYSGDPLTPQGWQLETDGVYVAGGSPIYNARTYNSYFGLVGTGIPIFTVSDNTTASFDAVNHYITTGDYSGADNYAELYPDNPESYVAIDVISGDWYKVVNSAWVKQGTLNLKGSDVVANPEGEATDTLTTIEIDGTVYDIAGGGASITDLIPLMTSDTTPSGTVSYSSQFGSSYAGYMAFNQVQADISMMTGGWLPSDSDGAPYLQYAWTSPKKLSKLWIETANNGASAQKTITVEGYNGTSWENCLKSGNTVTLDFDYGQYKEFEIELNGNNYSAIRISGNESWFVISSTACTISRMQVYSISGGISTSDVSYDNTQSGLSANKVQGAIDELADEKADASNVYTKSETDTLLNAKANTADLGTASAKDFTTSVTQGSNDLVTSGAVWTAIDNLPEPMIFKGTLGTNGTITSLPTASSSNEGWTYKVITAGTYAGQSAKVGDLFTSNATEWVYIPSGDETDTDTWRGINVNGSQLLGNGISSGNVNFKSGTNAQVSGSGNDVTIDVDTTFTDASSRVNITSGDSIKTILGKIKKWFADLKTVAFSGSYNDLTDKPTIPTVNNATLNIKKNGTSQGTFTANASTDVNIDISVPTKTSDLTNDSGYITDAGVSGVKGNHESTYRTGNVNLTSDNVEAVRKLFDLNTALGSDSPASAAKTYFLNNINNISVEVGYNSAGEEYALIFSRGDSNSYGSILRYTYAKKYLEILRRHPSGSYDGWFSEDWERIWAGYADKAGADADGNNIASTYLNKSTGGTITGQTRFNASIHGGSGQTIYGGEANISQWYKITLAPNGITPPSGTRRWYMISFTIRLGGDYDSNPHGIIFVCYYVYWDGTNFIYTDATCNATSFGHKIDTVRIYYNQSDPFKLYVAVHNAYSTIWIDHVTYRDTAAAYMDRETTVEAISAIDTTQYISLPIAYISASNSGDFMINRILHPSTDNTYDLGLSSYKWKSVYIGTSGTISSGNTKAVTGGTIYDYHNTTPLQISTKCYAEKSGNVVNVQCNGDTLNAISSIPSGYRPKRSIDVPATIIDSNNNYRYSGYIYINNDGSISGGWYKDGEIAHFLSTTDTRYQLYFNTTYIV